MLARRRETLGECEGGCVSKPLSYHVNAVALGLDQNTEAGRRAVRHIVGRDPSLLDDRDYDALVGITAAGEDAGEGDDIQRFARGDAGSQELALACAARELAAEREEAAKVHKHPHTSLRSTSVGSNSGEGQVISARPESEKVVNIDWRAPGEGEGGSMLDSFNVKDVAATRSADSVIESVIFR